MPVSQRQRIASCRIRLIEKSEIPIITQLDKDVFGDIDGGYPDFFFSHMAYMYPSTFWVSSDFSGYCLVTLGEYSPWLYSIGIKESARGLGLGGRFLQIAELYLRKRNYPTIMLSVDINNEKAIQFYIDHHFRIIDKRTDIQPNKLVMKKVL